MPVDRGGPSRGGTTTTTVVSATSSGESTGTTTTHPTNDESAEDDERYVTYKEINDDETDDGTDTDDEGTDDDADGENVRDVLGAFTRANGSHGGTPTAEFRLTCPDKTGLGADICRVVFEFGLVVTRGDFTTDGVWALVLLTVRAGHAGSGEEGGLVGRGGEGEEASDGAGGRTGSASSASTAASSVVGKAVGYAVSSVKKAVSVVSGGRFGGYWSKASVAERRRSRAGARSAKIRRFINEPSAHGGDAAASALMDTMPRTCVVDWELLRQRLELLCPHKSAISTIPSSDSLQLLEQLHSQQNLYILQVEAHDRVGLLHDVTLALWELQLSVHRAHVTTSPSGKAVDLFYVTDDLHELPNPARVGDISRRVKPVAAAVGAQDTKDVNVLVHPAPSFVTRRGRTKPLRESMGMVVIEARPPVFNMETTVEVDNLMSPAHTVFQIRTRDRQGLLYDCLRVSKDLKVPVSYAKIEIVDGTTCEVSLFTRNIKDQEQTDYLCSKYKDHVDQPLKVEMLCSPIDGLTSELRVVAPMDISGHARPRVLINVTEALQDLDVMVFKADILIDPSTVDNEIQDEVHRFLLTDRSGEPISRPEDRQRVCDRVLAALLR
jgi:hypothetical protein